MTYSGAAQAENSRELLGTVLEALQSEPDIPEDVMSVAQFIARAVSALFEAEHASSELDGRASVRHAMGSLSQTMALLQDVKTRHAGIDKATEALAQVMSNLYPLGQSPSQRPSSAAGPSAQAKPPREPTPVSAEGPRSTVEANVGATTESNFYVGFSGEVSEGGVFVATYNTLPQGTPVQLLITLPGGFQCKAPGVVRYVRDPMDFSMDSEPGMGIDFESLGSRERELILRFIGKRAPIFYDD